MAHNIRFGISSRINDSSARITFYMCQFLAININVLII